MSFWRLGEVRMVSPAAPPGRLPFNAADGADAVRVVASSDLARVHVAVLGGIDGQHWLDVSSSADGGASWSIRRRLANPASPLPSTSDHLIVDMVASADGARALVSWFDLSGSPLPQGGAAGVLRAAATTDAGLSWSSPRQISNSGHSAYSAKLAASADLSQITAVAGRLGEAQGYQTQTATSLDGGLTWPRQGSLPAVRDIATTADGAVLVATWIGGDGEENMRVFAARSTDRGLTWSASQPISPTSVLVSELRVVASADGSTLATLWTQAFNFNDIVLYTSRSRDQGTSWMGPVQIAEGACLRCALGVSSDGNRLTAIWTDSLDDDGPVRASSSLGAGLAWTAPVSVSRSGGPINALHLGLSPDGHQVRALWSRDNGSHRSAQLSGSINAGAAWSETLDLYPVDASASNPRMASSGDASRAMILWDALIEGEILPRVSSTRDEGDSWTTHALPGGDRSRASLAMSKDGSVGLIIRSSRVGDSIEVAIDRSADGGATWDAPVRLSLGSYFSDRPIVRLSADGSKALAAWVGMQGEASRLLTSRSVDGGVTWSLPAPAFVQSTVPNFALLELSDDGSRAALLAQSAEIGSRRLILAQSSDGGATWGSAAVLTAAGVYASEPGMQASSDGSNIVVAWKQSTPSNVVTARATRSMDGGVSWSLPALLGDSSGFNDEVRVAGGSNGVWNVLWRADNGFRIARSLDGGATWGTPFNPSPQSSATSTVTALQSSDDGRNLSMVWNEPSASLGRVAVSSSTSAGVRWSTRTRVISGERYVNFPQLALSADGARALVAWTAWDTGSTNLQAARGTGLDLPVFQDSFESP
jgi:hypothetical protein